MWMNECEIDDAISRYRAHPVLGPAVVTLSSLRNAVNASSDGWPYWSKPARAADKLMTLIAGPTSMSRYGDRDDATPAALKAALIPVKAFRTREKLSFRIIENLDQLKPGPDPFAGIRDGQVTQYRAVPSESGANAAIEMIVSTPAHGDSPSATVKVMMDWGTLRSMADLAARS
jgi:hypothetical protein